MKIIDTTTTTTANAKFNTNSKTGADFSIFIFLMFFIMMMRGSYVKMEVYITFLLMLIWIFTALISDVRSFIQAVSKKNVVWVCILIMYIFILSLSSTSIVTSIGAIIDYMTLYIGVLMFNYYDVKCPEIKLRRLVLAIIAIWMFFVIKALIFYSNNPYAGRVLISDYGAYGNVAIGDAYGIAFGTALIAVYLFGLLTIGTVRRLKIKVAIVILVAILYYLVTKTGSTITLGVMLIGLTLDIVIYFYRGKIKKNSLRKFFWTSVVILIMVLMLLNTESIGKWIVDITSGSGDLLANKLNNIGMNLLYDSSVGSLGIREGLYLTSVETFFKHPLLGSVIQNGLNAALEYTYIGNHSEFFDALGRFGIIGSLPLFMIYISSIKQEIEKYGSIYSWAYVVTFILMFIFNPFHYNQGSFALFFVIPAISAVVIKKSVSCDK